MSLLRPASTRFASARAFSTTPSNRGSMLFALSALSNRQETQHFAKHSRLGQVDHSPALELIRNSEVKPFAKEDVVRDAAISRPTPKNDVPQPAILSHAQPSAPILQPQQPPSQVDAAMLQTLQQMSVQLATLEAKLVEMGIETEKDVRRTGALVTVLVAGAVAGLGIWKFWPPESVRRDGEFRRKHLAKERSRVVPAEIVGQHTHVMGEPAVFQPAPVVQVEVEGKAESWWRSLFWREG